MEFHMMLDGLKMYQAALTKPQSRQKKAMHHPKNMLGVASFDTNESNESVLHNIANRMAPSSKFSARKDTLSSGVYHT